MQCHSQAKIAQKNAMGFRKCYLLQNLSFQALNNLSTQALWRSDSQIVKHLTNLLLKREYMSKLVSKLTSSKQPISF